MLCFGNFNCRQSVIIIVAQHWNFVSSNYKHIKLAHFILTDTSEGTTSKKDMSKALNRSLQKIRDTINSRNGNFVYVWTVERQKRGALHYHLIVLYDRAYIMPSPTELGKSWGLGWVYVVPGQKSNQYDWKRHGDSNGSWKPLFNYVSKYISKDGGENIEGRMFGGSNLPQIYKLSADRLKQVLAKFGRDCSERMKCTYTKVWGVWAPEGIEIMRWLLFDFPTDWRYAGSYK